MVGYWNRAIDRYNGDIFSMSQWTAWGPFYHFYLTFIFKILTFLHLFNHKLEIVLFLNIVYSTISVYCLYFISLQVIKNINYSLLITLFYAFSYPLIYLNSFILTESFATPILIFSVYLVFAYHEKKLIMFLAGLIFGVAVAARPAMCLMFLPFFLYILYARKPDLNSILRGVIFACGFFLVIFIILAEIFYISKGELISLYGSSGATFFLFQCKHSVMESTSRGYYFVIAPPFTSNNHPGWEVFKTDHPLHDQRYFYELGLQCMKKNSHFLLDGFKSLKALFFTYLFPSVGSAANFALLINLSNYFIFFMTIMLGFLYFLLKDKVVEIKKILFLISLLLCTIIMSFFFPPEQRYLYPVLFTIYLLFFTVILHVKKYKQQFLNYIRAIVVAYFAYLFLH